jgi:hypothetical protein
MTIEHTPVEPNSPRPESSRQAITECRQELEGEGAGSEGNRAETYRAARKLTSPLLPIMAVVITALTYLLPEELVGEAIALIGGLIGLAINEGVLACLVGLIVAFIFWIVFAYPARSRATARESSPPNYHQITEALDSLIFKICSLHADGSVPVAKVHENGLDEASRRAAREEVVGQIKKIKKRLEDGGMAWVTGAGYIELWHRIHRAQEAMIKLEPLTEVAEGAMLDDERLRDATIENSDRLLDRLRCAVAVFEAPGANGYLRYLPESKECNDPTRLGMLDGNADKDLAQAINDAEAIKEELRPAAIAILAETRYEINRFRDNSWEGIVNARNHLLDTSWNLGLMTYALLAFTLIMTPDPNTILWAAIYFLIGVITALFARARIEWSTASAVDDFGLTRARLIHLPWLAGLAAVGGVLVTTVLGPQLAGATGGGAAPTLAEVFNGGNTSLLLVAAVFGLTPDLIIRRLEQQTEKYKADLESTQSTQSTESSVKIESGVTRKQLA